MDALLKYAAFAAGALLLVKYLFNRAKADSVLASLNPRKDHSEEDKELGRLEQEVKDAKIKYDNARRDLSRNESGPGGVS